MRPRPTARSVTRCRYRRTTSKRARRPVRCPRCRRKPRRSCTPEVARQGRGRAAPVPARRAHVGRWTPPAAAQVEEREGSVVCLSRGLVRSVGCVHYGVWPELSIRKRGFRGIELRYINYPLSPQLGELVIVSLISSRSTAIDRRLQPDCSVLELRVRVACCRAAEWQRSLPAA